MITAALTIGVMLVLLAVSLYVATRHERRLEKPIQSLAVLPFNFIGAEGKDDYNDRVRPPSEVYPKAEAAAIRALQIDGGLAEAHTMLGVVRLFHNWNWTAAEREYKRALELSPDSVKGHGRYGLGLMWVGRFDEAISQYRRAAQLDPLSTVIQSNWGLLFYAARRYDEAIAELQKALEMDPNFHLPHRWLGRVYIEKRMYEAAFVELKTAIALGAGPGAVAELGYAYAISGDRRAAVRSLGRLETLSQQGYVPAFDRAVVHAGLRETDRALEWLERSFHEHERWMIYLKVDPLFDGLRSDPRFADLLRRVGLSP